MDEKKVSKSVRFDKVDVRWLLGYVQEHIPKEERETRGGGDGFADAIRHAVRALKERIDGRSTEDLKVLDAYYGLKQADEDSAHDLLSLAAGVADHPETAGALHAALEMQRVVLGPARSGAIRRSRKATRKGRKVS